MSFEQLIEFRGLVAEGFEFTTKPVGGVRGIIVVSSLHHHTTRNVSFGVEDLLIPINVTLVQQTGLFGDFEIVGIILRRLLEKGVVLVVVVLVLQVLVVVAVTLHPLAQTGHQGRFLGVIEASKEATLLAAPLDQAVVAAV